MNPIRHPGPRRRPPVTTFVAVAVAAFWFLSAAVSAAQPEEPININTASAEELMELPRVGEVTAARIIAWREENGPFAEIEELLNVQGIGERTFERIRPHVTVDKPAKPRADRTSPPVHALATPVSETDRAVRG